MTDNYAVGLGEKNSGLDRCYVHAGKKRELPEQKDNITVQGQWEEFQGFFLFNCIIEALSLYEISLEHMLL